MVVECGQFANRWRVSCPLPPHPSTKSLPSRPARASGRSTPCAASPSSPRSSTTPCGSLVLACPAQCGAVEGFWKYWQRFTAGTFLILVGVSLTLVYRRERERRGPGERIFPSSSGAVLKIFGLGMIITVVVTVAGVGYVDFGILHLIGASTILAIRCCVSVAELRARVVLRHRRKAIYACKLRRALDAHRHRLDHDHPFIDGRWLARFGITPTYYPAVDHFPLIPWFGVVLLGVWFGNWFYAGNQRLILLPDWGDMLPIRGLRFLGRHSLVIYLVHQPLILLVLMLLGIVSL